jgi:hypothetical protein
MRLFRDNIGLVSCLALMALGINLALSFGHMHAIGRYEPKALVAAVVPSDETQTGHHNDGTSDDLCPICMAAVALANSSTVAPPALPRPVAYVFVDRAAEAAVAFVEQARAAFQSRAPPVS